MTETPIDLPAKMVKAREAINRFRDFAREHGMDHFRRDPLVMDIHRALDASVAEVERLTVENRKAHVKIDELLDEIRAANGRWLETKARAEQAEAALAQLRKDADAKS